MKSRLWLMFQPRLVTQPVVFELGKKFDVVTNIRQASVNEEIGRGFHRNRRRAAPRSSVPLRGSKRSA